MHIGYYFHPSRVAMQTCNKPQLLLVVKQLVLLVGSKVNSPLSISLPFLAVGALPMIAGRQGSLGSGILLSFHEPFCSVFEEAGYQLAVIMANQPTVRCQLYSATTFPGWGGVNQLAAQASQLASQRLANDLASQPVFPLFRQRMLLFSTWYNQERRTGSARLAGSLAIVAFLANYLSVSHLQTPLKALYFPMYSDTKTLYIHFSK